ncbi:unnamed protein product [Fraxinus pennsylvanica]|uniref:MADS-box domain-containing protein n=1 Tax=Fraxinus pennsylvanica TaxID=56036 RepID=A0AAD2AH14_9LAMI|nr:unnamed protein product [Fraxinus pennsylvanica]
MVDDEGGSDNHSRPETKKFMKDELKSKNLTRKECIKKKTMELSVLCDVKACAVILGPEGQIETWPENHSDVQEMIELYKKDCLNNKKRKHQHDDHGCKKKQVLEGCSFAKYATSEEPDKLDNSFSYPASELGNPLCGGIPPNARPPKISQNLGSHSSVGMLRLGNQLPVDIMSSTPGYIGGFPGNVDGMHLGPLVSSAPMSQLVPQMQQLLGFSGQFTVPQSQMLHNAPSAPQQGPVMKNLRQIPAQQFQSLTQALSQFAQMQSQQKQTQQASSQSSQQAFSLLQQQLQMPQSSDCIDCATAQSWFQTESTVIAGVEQFQQSYIDNNDDSSRIDSFELSAAESDPFSTGGEWTNNQICTSSNGLDTGFELPPTQSSPPSSCFSDTSMPLGEEDELAVLLQQFQPTTPTLDSFNPDCGSMDTLGLSYDVTVQ